MRYTTTVRYERAGEGYDCIWEQETEIPDDLPGPMGNQVVVERFMEQMLRQSVENLKLLIELMIPQPV